MAEDLVRAGADRVEELARRVLAGDSVALARAITLVESGLPDDEAAAEALLEALLPATGGALRVGVSGAPGVGKSTLIDALGMLLVERGQRVAVLAVDPSSSRSGGSILGDKSRMDRLAREPSAYIRPSPSALTLGGVARRTRESLLLCEAAGYDVVLVETVGVGQSEIAVAGMVDFFLVLVLAGAGDELQGIKRGILELADLVAVTKADGDNAGPAQRASAEYTGALSYQRPRSSWRPRAATVSAIEGSGVAEIWAAVEEHHELLSASGELVARRGRQLVAWLESALEDRVMEAFRTHPEVASRLPDLRRAVAVGEITPRRAATTLLAASGAVVDR